MNVLEVLAVTTVLYFVIVAVWVLKIEDIVERRSERQASENRGETR